jgi:23S rRNA pseudouridine2605 synthase
MRIQKYLSQIGYCSRRKAEELIKQGKVLVNGEIVSLGYKIEPELIHELKINLSSTKIENPSSTKIWNEEILNLQNQAKIYLIFNKPIGYTCTKKIFKNEENIFSLLPKKLKNLKSAGRLDKNTSGLLILTNDGDFIQKITHPKYNCNKVYEVLINGILTQEEIQQFENGINLTDGMTSKAQLEIIEKKPYQTFLKVTIHEGKKRQIRRMFEFLGHKVIRLNRIQIGKIKLPKNLKKGDYVFTTIDKFID